MRKLSTLAAWRCWLPFLVSFFFLAVTGCGSSKKPVVSGTVRLNNEPLNGGIVIFESEEEGGGGGTATIIEGAYTLHLSKPGKMKIYIRPRSTMTPIPGGRGGPPKDSEAPEGAGSRPVTKKKESNPIPQKYTKLESSPLTLDVQPGKQEYNIELK